MEWNEMGDQQDQIWRFGDEVLWGVKCIDFVEVVTRIGPTGPASDLTEDWALIF